MLNEATNQAPITIFNGKKVRPGYTIPALAMLFRVERGAVNVSRVFVRRKYEPLRVGRRKVSAAGYKVNCLIVPLFTEKQQANIEYGKKPSQPNAAVELAAAGKIRGSLS